MAHTRQPIDSPTPWVADHIKEYLASDGKQGHIWRGAPTLLLTTTGRKSGEQRRTALIYGQDGDRYVVVASKGGAPRNPLWFLNLRDHPEAQIQVNADVMDVRARVAAGDERTRLWEQMAKIWPDYNAYQTRTKREIPVVVLEPSKTA